MKIFRKVLVGLAIVASLFAFNASAETQNREEYIQWSFKQHYLEFFERASISKENGMYYLEDERFDTHYYLTMAVRGGIIMYISASKQVEIDDSAACMVMGEGIELRNGKYAYDSYKRILYREPSCSYYRLSPNCVWDEVIDWFFNGERRGA